MPRTSEARPAWRFSCRATTTRPRGSKPGARERFALQATALNVRTAFINQPIEVRPLRPQFESWLNLKGEHALPMLRFGHGPTTPFSLRRPIDDVILAYLQVKQR